MNEQKDILEKRLDELAQRRTDKNWDAIGKQIEALYGYDFKNMVFGKSELYNSSGKNSGYLEMLRIDKEKTKDDFFRQIMSIEFFLNDRH